MDGESKTILCGSCKVPLQGPEDPGPKDTVACPNCDRGDTVENVVKEVEAYAEHEASRYLQDAARDAAQRSQFMTFDGPRITPRTFRFIVDLDL
ncbi:hypothetical protein [Palleronia pelagia]|uniref:hypothetical protein n=1 Tax=Palleronia pelagia TaxID=387096 RepID=UPI001114151E|nr:hypothetical protein [Palleronia pelagia]